LLQRFNNCSKTLVECFIVDAETDALSASRRCIDASFLESGYPAPRSLMLLFFWFLRAGFPATTRAVPYEFPPSSSSSSSSSSSGL
jgi:hypothetical protein